MHQTRLWRRVASLLLFLVSPASQALHCQTGDISDSPNGNFDDCPVASAIFTYNWQGVLTSFDDSNTLLATDTSGLPVTVSGTLNYDGVLGIGELTVNNPDLFGLPSVWQPVTLTTLDGFNLIQGTASVLWSGQTLSLPFVWDASGLMGASRNAGGIQLGAGAASPCYQTAACGYAFPGISPFSGPAFLATLDDQPGNEDGISGVMTPVGLGLNPSWNLDVYQLTAVPLPAAVWLFGSGLAALFSFSLRGRQR